jgi:hypothetical protein
MRHYKAEKYGVDVRGNGRGPGAFARAVARSNPHAAKSAAAKRRKRARNPILLRNRLFAHGKKLLKF